MKHNYKTVNLIATYEELLVPREEHITEYIGDMGDHFIKNNITDEQIKSAYTKALATIEMSDDEFQSNSDFTYRGEIISRMRDCLLAKSLETNKVVLFVSPEPNVDGKFAFRYGVVLSVNARKKLVI